MRSRVLVAGLLLGLGGPVAAAPTRAPLPPPVAVDWATFLGRQDLVWPEAPTTWDDAPFIGNGNLGATIHMTGGSLGWELNRTDVTHGGQRYPMGRLSVQVGGGFGQGNARLDLWNAEARGELATPYGDLRWRSFVSTNPSVVVIELMDLRNEPGAELVWLPTLARPPHRGPRLQDAFPANELHPPPQVDVVVGGVNSTQTFLGGGAYALVLRRIFATVDRKIYVVSIQPGRTADQALSEANVAADRAANLGFDALLNTHRVWWHAYYPASFVSVPDDRLQAFYWIQMYKLASELRLDGPIPDLIGPWYRPNPPALWIKTGATATAPTIYSTLYAANRVGQLARVASDPWKQLLARLAAQSARPAAAPAAKRPAVPEPMSVRAAEAEIKLGKGDTALAALRDVLDRHIRPNTFYAGTDPGQENPFAAASCVQDMLLQSGKNLLRVFPAMPVAWKEASFANLRGDGGFLVSGVWQGAGAAWVKIESQAGGSCRVLVRGWNRAVVRLAGARGGSVSPAPGSAPGLFTLNVPKGGWVVLTPAPNGPLPRLGPVTLPASAPANPYPLHYQK